MLLRVLLVGGSDELRGRLYAAMSGANLLILEEPRSERLWGRLGQEGFDLVIAAPSAMPLPQVAEIRKLPERPEVIVIDSGSDSTRRAQFQSAGTFAIVSPDLTVNQLKITLGTIIERYREIAVDRLRADERPRSALDDFSSNSTVMKRLLALGRKVVAADSSLLILGETGVGKEWLGRAIHAEGPRSAAPFVAISCAAVPETLLESELFGHEKGAFTGAVKARRGAFELAHQGTLFLDEIGDVPVHLQVKLLRALQDQQIQRIGAERSTTVNVRIMAATNRDLVAAMEAQQFRRDLFYRLSVVTLSLPPLRERQEDIKPLIEIYFSRFKRLLNRQHLLGIEEEAIDAMVRHSWPGNVRELINVLERAVLLCEAESLSVVDLPSEIVDHRGSQAAAHADGPERFHDWLALPLDEGRRRLVEAFEREYLTRVLETAGGNISETARLSGISPRTLYNRMRTHGLRKEAFRSRPSPGSTLG